MIFILLILFLQKVEIFPAKLLKFLHIEKEKFDYLHILYFLQQNVEKQEA